MAIGWDENQPSDNSNAGLADDEFRSLKTALATGLGQSMEWPGSGGGSVASAGQMKLGVARTFFAAQSKISANSDGCLFIASDSSRLFGVGSEGTMFLGSMRAVEHVSMPEAGSRWVVASGGANNSVNFNFGMVYGVAPVLTLSAASSQNTFGCAIVSALTTGGATVDVARSNGVPYGSSLWSIYWTSIGTVGF